MGELPKKKRGYKIDLKTEYKKGFKKFAESSKIVSKEGGEPISFQPKKIQLDHIKNWHNRSVVLKPRQCGFTTLKNLELLFFASVIKNGSLILVFHDEKVGRRKLQLLKDQITWVSPEYKLSIDPTYSNRDAFRILPSGSTITVSTGSGFDPARGTTNQVVLGSEFAYWRRDKQSMDSLEKTVPTGGVICLESTPEGQDNLFYTKYHENVGKPADSPLQYKTYFYPWYMDEDNKIDPPKNMELTKEEVELIEKYNLTFGQIYWRRKIMGEPTVANIIQFNKSYPVDDESCWGLAIQGSRFDTTKLMQMEIKKPLREDGGVRIYQEYNQLDRYYMGIDGAKGRNDDNAFVIINKKLEIIAAFNSNDISCTGFAKLALEYAQKYHAYTEIEGDSWGYHIAYLFEEKKYLNFILNPMTEYSKTFLIRKISDWIELNNSYIDKELRTRLMLFTGDRRAGDRDDICMAFGHALMSIGEEYRHSETPLTETVSMEQFYHDIDRNKQEWGYYGN